MQFLIPPLTKDKSYSKNKKNKTWCFLPVNTDYRHIPDRRGAAHNVEYYIGLAQIFVHTRTGETNTFVNFFTQRFLNCTDLKPTQF